MNKEEIDAGVAIAQKALIFALFSHGEVKAGECRIAIRTLFGREVDEELSKRFATGQEFEKRTTYKPEQDDLERANCEQAGTIGHWSCGWCVKHDKPRFMCGCLLKYQESNALLSGERSESERTQG